MQRNIIITPNHPGYVSGRYYQNVIGNIDGTSSAAYAVNTITYTPFKIERNVTIDRIAVSCAGTVTNAAIRFGIFSNNNGLPNNLLLDTGEIIAASTGIKEAIISLNLSSDWYWIGGAVSIAPNLYGVASSYLGNNYFLGQSTPSTNTPIASIRNAGFTYGAMPSIAPTNNLSSITGISPLFWFRVA